jgi:hypothetical protein
MKCKIAVTLLNRQKIIAKEFLFNIILFLILLIISIYPSNCQQFRNTGLTNQDFSKIFNFKGSSHGNIKKVTTVHSGIEPNTKKLTPDYISVENFDLALKKIDTKIISIQYSDTSLSKGSPNVTLQLLEKKTINDASLIERKDTSHHKFIYDDNNRLKEEYIFRPFLNGSTSYYYDESNRLINKIEIDNNGIYFDSIRYVYDSNNNVIKELHFEKNGKIKEFSSIYFQYNSLNQMIHSTNSLNYLNKYYKYDNIGRLIEVMIRNNGSNYTILVNYDIQNNPIEIKENLQNGFEGSITKFEYKYDDFSNIIEINTFDFSKSKTNNSFNSKLIEQTKREIEYYDK